MKTLITSLKRQSGFTLVELMVVVAIIGLLSAVAVPNFKKYQAKAKISEARLQLSAAYTAQQAFFSDFGLYANCLRYMGFDPAPEIASRYYSIGFDSTNSANPGTTAPAWVSAVNSGMQDAGGCVNGNAGDAAGNQFPAGKGVGSVIINTDALHLAATTLAQLGAQTDSASMTFVMTAAGVISGDAATATIASALRIDHAKVIGTVRQGY